MQIGAAAAHAPQPLSADQQRALGNLHSAATQFEGVFLQMLMSAMRETVPQDSLFGESSGAEQTWQAMLDDRYSQQMAQSGGFGLAGQLESQMRSAVLANAKNEAHADTTVRNVGP